MTNLVWPNQTQYASNMSALNTAADPFSLKFPLVNLCPYHVTASLPLWLECRDLLQTWAHASDSRRHAAGPRSMLWLDAAPLNISYDFIIDQQHKGPNIKLLKIK
jgi:hypothetical protein